MGEAVFTNSEITTWIIAICAALGLLGALAALWVGVKTDIATLQATVNSLDSQLALTVKQLTRVENLVVGLWNGRTP